MVARSYDVNANLIFKWRRDPRYRPTENGEGARSFLPAVAAPASASDGLIKVALANGVTDMRKLFPGLAAQAKRLERDRFVWPSASGVNRRSILTPP